MKRHPTHFQIVIELLNWTVKLNSETSVCESWGPKNQNGNEYLAAEKKEPENRVCIKCSLEVHHSTSTTLCEFVVIYCEISFVNCLSVCVCVLSVHWSVNVNCRRRTSKEMKNTNTQTKWFVCDPVLLQQLKILCEIATNSDGVHAKWNNNNKKTHTLRVKYIWCRSVSMWMCCELN